jgi:hypothetical protein
MYAKCPAHIILLVLIILIICGENSRYEAPHYAVFASLQKIYLSSVKNILLGTLEHKLDAAKLCGNK